MAVDVVDWDLALSTGSRLAPNGPEIGLEQARTAVQQLRQLSSDAVAPVRECTQLIAPDVAPPAAVIDRRSWIESNINSFQFVLNPVLERVRRSQPSAAVSGVGSRLTAVQMGAVLAWLSGKVLGQYEALVPPGQQPRLMLVAPNIAEATRTLGADERDFAMWVCLHEETHRVQFTAVPWLSDFFAAETQLLVAAVDVPASELLAKSGQLAGAVLQVLRGKDGAQGMLRSVLTPTQQDVFDRISALMTLLEGHADVVMDEVGPEIVPSVADIRAKFNDRRTNPGALDSVIRRVLGMDAKMRQYSEGAAFVRAVIDEVGMTGFNAVWQSPDTLPTLAEIERPHDWLRRVHDES